MHVPLKWDMNYTVTNSWDLQVTCHCAINWVTLTDISRMIRKRKDLSGQVRCGSVKGKQYWFHHSRQAGYVWRHKGSTQLFSETAPIPAPVKVMDQKTRCPESGIGRCHLEITRVILWTKTELRKDECILYLHTHTHPYGPHHQNYESPDSQFL